MLLKSEVLAEGKLSAVTVEDSGGMLASMAWIFAGIASGRSPLRLDSKNMIKGV